MKRYGTQRFEGNRLNLKQNFIITGMLFLLFIGFTIAVKTVDVRAVVAFLALLIAANM